LSGTPPPPEKDSHTNRGTLGQPPMGGRTQLSAQQLHDHENEPSWKAPNAHRAPWSAQRVIVLVILLLILGLVIYLKVAGVV
jgi:hypothetical protein